MAMKASEMLPDIAFMEQLANAAAAETMPLFRSAAPIDNKDADAFDPVTAADRNAEIAIRALIEDRYPEHGIIGEEHGTVRADHSHVWIIDPIDGTRAFIAGLPVWGTLVGLCVNGFAKAGLMSQPFTGELFVADGHGTSLIRNGGNPTALSTRQCDRVDEAIMFTTSPTLYSEGKRDLYERVEEQVRLARYGCDCYAFAMLAAGYADLVIEPDLMTYDIAALIPLIEQAGGVVTTWDGGNAARGGDVIAAATRELHAAALDILHR